MVTFGQQGQDTKVTEGLLQPLRTSSFILKGYEKCEWAIYSDLNGEAEWVLCPPPTFSHFFALVQE